MTTLTKTSAGAQILAELQEFASFPLETQDYIRDALAARFGFPGSQAAYERRPEAAASADARVGFYARIDEIAAALPRDGDLIAVAGLMRGLVALTAFDIAHTALGSFAAYRFLYERLIGAAVRPWLAGAFCTAAALPQLHPQHRRRLLASLDAESVGAAGWTDHEPMFDPRALDREEA